MTGPTPPAALEAAHLYSYAEVGEHHDHGGLLLRRDLHNLFDTGLLAVDPGALTVDVDPEIQIFPSYAELNGRPLGVTVTARQRQWLGAHWQQHRVGPPTR
jgi:hypothetical protein